MMNRFLICFILIALLVGLPAGAAFSQTLTVTPIPRDRLSRSDFLTQGYSGSVALVAGNINSSEQAEIADDLRLLQPGACYPLIDFPRSRTRRLYFAISQAATNTTYRNAFLAAQVIRFVRSPQSGSDIAVSRNKGPWVTIRGNPRPSPGADWNFLGKTAEEFVDAHSLRDGSFQDPKVDAFFTNTKDGKNVRWHARLPRKLSAEQIDGYYSSLDPGLEPVWTGLIKDFAAPPQVNYRRFIRNYLISLDFGSLSGRPIVFATDPLDAEYVIVRIQSAPGSNLSTNHTFAFGLTSSGCGFLGRSSGGLFSWFRN
jgi:hypothetical protein